jgi:hypothetical protein
MSVTPDATVLAPLIVATSTPFTAAKAGVVACRNAPDTTDRLCVFAAHMVERRQ